MGVQVPPDAVGGHSATPEEVRSLRQHVKAYGSQGVFVWSIQKMAAWMSAEDICIISRRVFFDEL